ncbi:MAG: hypothetical protein V4736_13035, partial [Bdellovibrionota bacterium]
MQKSHARYCIAALMLLVFSNKNGIAAEAPPNKIETRTFIVKNAQPGATVETLDVATPCEAGGGENEIISKTTDGKELIVCGFQPSGFKDVLIGGGSGDAPNIGALFVKTGRVLSNRIELVQINTGQWGGFVAIKEPEGSTSIYRTQSDVSSSAFQIECKGDTCEKRNLCRNAVPHNLFPDVLSYTLRSLKTSDKMADGFNAEKFFYQAVGGDRKAYDFFIADGQKLHDYGHTYHDKRD